MQPCFILGGALHTNLGADISTQLHALQHAPTAPGTVVIYFAEKAQAVPYKLLSGTSTDNPELKLNAVVDQLVAQALETSKLSADERAAMGLFIGTSSFNINVVEQQYRHALMHDDNALAMATYSSQGIFGHEIRHRHGLRGPDFSFNTACTASANALLYADAMIRSGRLQHALVLGVELCNSITALGFHGLQLLTSSAMKPFDRSRNGLILGEGCSALVLGNKKPAGQHWQLKGAANVCDTHSISATNPDGSVIARVITTALQSARLAPADIGAIKVHGTASLLNDEAEAAGMRKVFTTVPPLTAIKPFIGHTLGACGLNELLLFCAAADTEMLIATPGIGNNDDAQGDDKIGVSLNQSLRALPPGNFLMNYFGFGGNNTALVISNIRE
jgi:3-oxoacyl-[acyl-carrier-protein] synthase-1